MSIICTTYNCAFLSLFKLLIKMLDRTDSHNNAHNTNILYFYDAKALKNHIHVHDLISFDTIIMGGRKGNLFFFFMLWTKRFDAKRT